MLATRCRIACSRSFCARLRSLRGHQLQVHHRRIARALDPDTGVDRVDLLELPQGVLDALDALVGVIEARSDRHRQPHRGVALVRLRHHFGADHAGDRDRNGETRRRDRERGLAVRECQAQQPVVDAVHAVHQALEAPQHRPDQRQPARTFRRVAPHGRQHRVQREADEQRHQHGGRDGDAERIEELADDAAHERDRHEHGDDRKRRRQHRQPDLVGAFARGARSGPCPCGCDARCSRARRSHRRSAARCTATAPSASCSSA